MAKNVNEKLILLDLDGVLNIYSGQYDEKCIPPLKDGANFFLKELSQSYKLKIFTTRDKYLTQEWLFKNNISKYISGITNKKEPCWLLIDDRCLTFEGDFKSLMQRVENFKPWYKKD